ncbi:MAG TPA: hypothetical protein VKQ08_00180, partial [Cyclobacteriaceae bacterium]|nr:hypothetical protein [Cyclobacteriaceae bacterium]
MNRFLKYRLDHVFFWSVTVLFHAYTRTDLIERAGYGQFLLEIILRNGLLALPIYANLRFLWPTFLKKGNYFMYFSWLTASLTFYVVVKNAHDVYLYGVVLGITEQRNFFYHSLYNFSIVSFYLA